MTNKKQVYVIQHNHFDPIWRRCWDRTFDYQGKRYRSYADIEEHLIDRWLINAKRGATWSEGQSVVFRKYLERHPERYAEIKDYVDKGIIELTAAGETVSDTNMPSGETLLRNLALGQWYFEENFGVIPSIGWLEDAFGQSAQIPQIFRGAECTSVWKLCYKRVPGEYWRGLDGSVIAIAMPPEHFVGHFTKSPPCPDCSGVGCDKCDNLGITDAAAILDVQAQGAVWADFKNPYTYSVITGEETIPNLNLPDYFEQAKKERKDIDLHYGTFQMIADNHLKEQIARIDDPDIKVSDQVEANAVSAGCYVSRIKIKQEMRRLENLLYSAERWATVAHLLGADYPTENLLEAWRDTVFIGFHDAITSTHIDQAYYELLDMMEETEIETWNILHNSLDTVESQIKADPDKDYLVVYNSESWERRDPVTITLTGTRGVPSLTDASGKELDILDIKAQGMDVDVTFAPPTVPALGYAAVEIKLDAQPIDRGEITKGPGEIENEFFKITVSDKGITSIIDKRTGKETIDTSKYLANELVLEEDIGDPWATTTAPGWNEKLAQYTTGVKIRKAGKVSEINLTGQYKGKDENVDVLTWRQSVKLYSGVDRIDFHTEIDWDTAQRRIRVAFPTGIKTNEATYAIPYGALKRGKHEGEWKNAGGNGDWPAINWVDIYDKKKDRGMALLNVGTPSHKVVNGMLFMSLLRSPANSWFLNEPHYYDCPDIDGARDSGRHEFTYSLIPHSGDYRTASIEKRGREFNTPMLVRDLSSSGEGKLGQVHSFLKLDAPDNVVITAIKKAEKDDSVVVRLAETGGMDAELSVHIEGAGKKQSLVNFLERHAEPVQSKIKLTPFKIKTIKLSK